MVPSGRSGFTLIRTRSSTFLGGSDRDSLRRAYRRSARVRHPDTEAAEGSFEELQRALGVALGDDDGRSPLNRLRVPGGRSASSSAQPPYNRVWVP
jgi:hypothetical protein